VRFAQQNARNRQAHERNAANHPSNKEKRPSTGRAAFSRPAKNLADDDRRAMVTVVALLLHDHNALRAMITPAVVMAPVLLDDDSLRIGGFGRRHRQSDAEGSQGRDCQQDLTHASFSSESDAPSNAQDLELVPEFVLNRRSSN
jgi:hypothetical protein